MSIYQCPSPITQEDAHLLELVRHIHLNPIRAHLVDILEELGRYIYCGHGVLMGKVESSWQDAGWVLGMFGKGLDPARQAYTAFVEEGIAGGRRADLTGGGLLS